jgi:transmembrane sensor
MIMKAPGDIERVLAHEASRWLETLRAGTESRKEFDAWLSQSQLHTDAFLRTLATDIELDRAGDEARRDPKRNVDVTALVNMINAQVVPLPSSGDITPTHASRSNRRRWLGAAVALAASIAMVTIAFVLVREETATETRVLTAAGEQRTITLPDASRVTLNASSQVRIAYSGEVRRVELRGEGIFKVTADAERPFIVSTPVAQIRAVGTEFNVYERGAEGALISVLEGRVHVVASNSSGSAVQPGQYLEAGEELEVYPTGRIEHHPNADVARTVAWRARRLPFEGATLDELVREFNRYSSVQFRVEGAAPPTRYGGIFDATDAQSLADYLSREPDLIVERDAQGFVIRRREQ